MLHSRIKRVQEQFQHELARIIAYDLNDPRVGQATVTGVKISKDLREAIVHVSFLEDDDDLRQEALDALEAARGFIKRLLAERIVLKRLPDPHFKLDTGMANAYHIYGILSQIRSEEPASPEPDDANC